MLAGHCPFGGVNIMSVVVFWISDGSFKEKNEWKTNDYLISPIH
jgi:hypothetical protein